jgi:hypothetical protein
MERRDFLKVGAAAGATMSWSGCLGILGGNEDDGGDGYAGEPVDPDADDDTGSGHRIDFVDQAETLGQVGEGYSSDNEYDTIVNNYSEEDWQEMDNNDLDVARHTLSNNDSSIEEIRPHVEQEIQNSPENEPDEKAMMRGIGIGINDESLVANSFDSENILRPLAEKFSDEYLENDTFEAWITAATIPATEGRFAHLPITIAYEHEGGLRRDYVEDAVPSAPGIGEDGEAIRSPEEAVYSDPDEREMVTGHEYRKALEMAQNGQIEQEGRAHPVRAISTGLIESMKNMVDSAQNDTNFDNPPPNGLVTHVSQEFGESVEDAFYDLDEQKLEYMENIGKATQLFYEEHGGRANLAIGGTLEQPEFYKFADAKKEQAWNFNYDDISELVA